MFKIKKYSFSYTQLIAFGFFMLIIVGALLLMLPISTRTGRSPSFIDALFTATSAACVTGLIVFDTYTQWSLFGQFVLLILIQIGGLGFMTIITMFSFFLGRRIGLSERSLLRESMNTQYIGGIIRLTRKILIGTLIFEGAGTLILGLCLMPKLGFMRAMYTGLFTSVSAFCNAGFDLMGRFAPYSSLTAFNNNPIIIFTVGLLIMIGGIGFFVWDDISVNRLHFRRYKLHTKIVLVTTAFLTICGSVAFLIFEYSNPLTMGGMSFAEKLTAAFFASVTPRTAGFNSIDIGAMTPASQLLTIIFMYIGGSPGSTAGGVKTTTIVAILLSVMANLRHRTGTNVFRRRLDDSSLSRATSVIVINFLLCISACLIISSVQRSLPLTDIIFECFSAIGTVGMSTGITGALNPVSQVVIIMLMYLGRVGSLTFALIFTERHMHDESLLPKEKISIG